MPVYEYGKAHCGRFATTGPKARLGITQIRMYIFLRFLSDYTEQERAYAIFASCVP